MLTIVIFIRATTTLMSLNLFLTFPCAAWLEFSNRWITVASFFSSIFLFLNAVWCEFEIVRYFAKITLLCLAQIVLLLLPFLRYFCITFLHIRDYDIIWVEVSWGKSLLAVCSWFSIFTFFISLFSDIVAAYFNLVDRFVNIKVYLTG